MLENSVGGEILHQSETSISVSEVFKFSGRLIGLVNTWVLLVGDALEFIWGESIKEKFNFVIIRTIFVYLEAKADGLVILQTVRRALDVGEHLALRCKVLENKELVISLGKDGLKLILESSLNRVGGADGGDYWARIAATLIFNVCLCCLFIVLCSLLLLLLV